MNTPTSLAQVDEPIGVHPGTDSRWPKKLYCTTGTSCKSPHNTSPLHNLPQIVPECQSIFNFRLPSVIIPDGCETFRVKYESCNNSLYKLALSPL